MQRDLIPSADASPVAVSANIQQTYEATPPLIAVKAFTIITPQIINMVAGYLTPQEAFRFLMHTCSTLRMRTVVWAQTNELVLNDKSTIQFLNKESVYYAVGAGIKYDSPYGISGSRTPSSRAIEKSFADRVFVFEDKNTAEFFKRASDQREVYLTLGHFIRPCKIVGSKKANQLAALKVEKNILPDDQNLRELLREQLKGSAIPFSVFRTSGKALTYVKEESAPKKATKR